MYLFSKSRFCTHTPRPAGSEHPHVIFGQECNGAYVDLPFNCDLSTWGQSLWLWQVQNRLGRCCDAAAVVLTFALDSMGLILTEDAAIVPIVARATAPE